MQRSIASVLTPRCSGHRGLLVIVGQGHCILAGEMAASVWPVAEVVTAIHPLTALLTVFHGVLLGSALAMHVELWASAPVPPAAAAVVVVEGDSGSSTASRGPGLGVPFLFEVGIPVLQVAAPILPEGVVLAVFHLLAPPGMALKTL